MIRKVKAKRKRKNPFLVEYGYHFTDEYNLESIMENGLVPGFKNNSWWYEYQDGCRKQIADQIYNKKSPIYFSDIPDDKNLPESLKSHFKNSNYNVSLKVDVSSLNQTPDIFMLIIDYGCSCVRDSLMISYLDVNPLRHKKIKSLTSEIEKYDYEIPFYALKEDGDQDLQSELIFLTGTFVVNQKIPPKYIEEIIKVK